MKRPVLLFDVMDTIVKDPFYDHMAPHFGMSFEELLASKHPHTWLRFERGECSESEALTEFFADGRRVDGDALKDMLVSRYEYLPGMEALLRDLREQGYEMHVVSNYPVWFELIEEKLSLSDYLKWSFLSCRGPMQGLRKPDPQVYSTIITELGVPAADAILIDDRQSNVDAAAEYGMQAVRFSCADSCRASLQKLQVNVGCAE